MMDAMRGSRAAVLALVGMRAAAPAAAREIADVTLPETVDVAGTRSR